MIPFKHDIFFKTGLNLGGRYLRREAVRGIITCENKLLLIFSNINGDFKFPGGGVKSGENHHDALYREIKEECGTELISITGKIGEVVEYNISRDLNYEVFTMTSHYYSCMISNCFGSLQLDEYEEQLGFSPVWISAEDAITANKAVLMKTDYVPPWTPRDTFVLEKLKNELESLK